MDDFVEKLRQDFPEFKFRPGKKFSFRFPKTITLGPDEPGAKLLLLHELGHAILGHQDFKTDVERLKMEVEAWEKARELAKTYRVEFNEEAVQDELDTYRDWLHKKSRCPKCGLTRFQDKDKKYHCPRCENLC
ncbi:hypothetical protein IJH24_03125 [Candidatus Saccharibacteria bacterium]|nr:hypothetical protein [Candidatus Saccharibacteria bacterium]